MSVIVAATGTSFVFLLLLGYIWLVASNDSVQPKEPLLVVVFSLLMLCLPLVVWLLAIVFWMIKVSNKK